MDVQPDLIEKLGNGTYYYNYDIKSKEVNVTDPETEDVTKETRWTYIQVHLHGQPDHKECIKAIIRQYVDQDEEFDLINSSNSIVLGLSDNQTDRQKYIDYLTLVGEIKTKVRADFNV
nr:MAG TPA: hypothetical protein [Caudoviricetes sp.]